jgi:tetratricopeptide (TPR) repeat protein
MRLGSPARGESAMRSLIKPAIVLAIIAGNTRTFAQHPDVDPRILPSQISQQELIVKSEAGHQDAEAWLKLAVLLQDAGRYSESEVAYLRTMDLMRSKDPLVRADVLDHMGTMYAESGQLSKAEPLERQALDTRIRQHDQLGTGVSRMHLAMLLLGEHSLRSAEDEANIAVELLVPEYSHSTATSAATPEEKMTALIDLSLVRYTLGESSSAIPTLTFAQSIAHANYPENSVPVEYINFLLGFAEWKSGNTKNAGELMRQGVHELATQIGWGQPAYASTLRQYRVFLNETGQTAEAQWVTGELNRLDHTADSAVAQTGNTSLTRNSPH